MRVGVGRLGAEAPGADGVAHADVEGAVAVAADRPAPRQHLDQVVGQVHQGPGAARFSRHQRAVGLQVRHLRRPPGPTAACSAAATGPGRPCRRGTCADQRVPIVGPFSAWRGGSEDVFDIAPLRFSRCRVESPSGARISASARATPWAISRPPQTMTRAPSAIRSASAARRARSRVLDIGAALCRARRPSSTVASAAVRLPVRRARRRRGSRSPAGGCRSTGASAGRARLPRTKPASGPMPAPAPIRISGAWPRAGVERGVAADEAARRCRPAPAP